ncbi:MAG TPA: PA14 domain-containing protein, partial [Planctomycetota bacterium]|nr:PA14 domain-containing protein [Planctomycetota bacterium]
APAPPAPVPEGALLIYGDTLHPGWRNFSWDMKTDLAASSPVFEGAHSIAAAPQKVSAGLYLGRPEGLDVSPYTHLSFRLYSRVPGAPLLLTLYQKKPTGRAIELHKLPDGLPADRWIAYTFPLKDLLASSEPVTGIVLQAFHVSPEPWFFVDHVLFLREPGVEAASPVSPALESYRTRRSEAAARAAGRDYAGAERILRDAMAALPEAARAEAQADLAALRSASEFLEEALRRASRLSRGEKAAVEFVGAGGIRRRREGTVLHADAVRVSLQTADGRVDIPLSEATTGWLVDLAAQHPGAGMFCVLEGDAERARAFKVAAPAWLAAAPAPEERAALDLFWTAEGLFPRTRRRAEAVEAYRKLLSEYGATASAARLHAFVSWRLEEAREIFWTADELTASEGFLAVKPPGRDDPAWISERSGADGAFLEFSFPASPDVPVRGWILAGACCLETLNFSIQATELSGPKPGRPTQKVSLEPGAPDALEVRLPSTSFRRYHASHGGGAREPARWIWVPLPLPRFSAAGVKLVRVIPDQAGFGAAAAFVSSTRSAPPRDGEVTEWVRSRPPFEPAVPTGRLLRETWTGIPGERLEDLTQHPSFIFNRPSSVDRPSGAFSDGDRGENYGARLRGFLHPPASGPYVFWLLSDDASELWISTDDNAAHKKKIAFLPHAVGRDEWEKLPSQKSAPVVLRAGQRCYVEAIYKQGPGAGFLALGWQLPDGAQERPIPAGRLSEFGTMPGRKATASFFKGINLGGPSLMIDGRLWEGGDGPTLSGSQGRFENQNVPLRPPTDETRARMIRCSAFDPSGTRVRVSSLPPGSYDVFLYVWEDNDPQVIDLFVQGNPVLRGYSTGPAGTWARLGPWRAEVRDGSLEVSCTGGHGNFSGLELWRIGP